MIKIPNLKSQRLIGNHIVKEHDKSVHFITHISLH